MKCFDAHSDIWTDVTIKRMKGETNVFHNHHFERLQKGGVEGSILVLWVDPPHIRDYAKRTHELFTCVKDEIAEVKAQISSTSLTVTRYEVLKVAFGQDGVPHQIIRNVIPYITQTANNILGSMTGGKMGVEFVLDKVTKGKDGEKATLDVLIEECAQECECEIRILAGCCNCATGRLVELVIIRVPLLFHASLSCKSERYIVATKLIKTECCAICS